MQLAACLLLLASPRHGSWLVALNQVLRQTRTKGLIRSRNRPDGCARDPRGAL